jgi:hypothetical protein
VVERLFRDIAGIGELDAWKGGVRLVGRPVLGQNPEAVLGGPGDPGRPAKSPEMAAARLY